MEKVSLKSKINEIRYELSKEMNKSGKNSYSNYSYFQLKDFMPRALELFNDKGVYTEFQIVDKQLETPSKTLTTKQFDENGVLVSETTTKDFGFEYKEVAILDVYNLDNEEDIIHLEKPTAEVRLQAAQPIQNLGGKSTYMKRYMYMDLLEINENDAVEEETGKPEKVETKTTTKKTTKKPAVTPVTTKVETVPEVVETPAEPVEQVSSQVDTDDLMTMETKLMLANKIKELGGDPRTKIIEIAKKLGTDVPLLKESDKETIINMIELDVVDNLLD